MPSFILNLCVWLSPLLLCWVCLQTDPYTRLSQLRSWYSLPVATRGHNHSGPGDGRSGLITVTQQSCQLREVWDVRAHYASNDIGGKLAVSASLPWSLGGSGALLTAEFTMPTICSTSVTQNGTEVNLKIDNMPLSKLSIFQHCPFTCTSSGTKEPILYQCLKLKLATIIFCHLPAWTYTKLNVRFHWQTG